MKLFASSFLRSLIAGVAWLAFGVSAALAQTALPNAQVGQNYSFQVTTTPAAAAGTVYAATGLPTGVSINTSSGLISGTPTTAGTATGTISLTSSGATNSFNYTLLVNPATGTPAITSAATATATVGQAFTYTVTASNSPTSFNIGTLPAGFTTGGTTTAPTIVGSSGGAPTTAGTFTITLSANNASGTGTSTTLTLTVNPAGPVPVISSATTATGTPNVAFTYTITASNTPVSFAATGLPLGLSINATSGLISGTPTVAGVSTIALTATNNNGTSTAVNLTLTVGALSSITSATTAIGGVGGTFSYTATASNTPLSYNASGLPAGLSLNATTGVISGTPTAVGTFTVGLSANNSIGTGPTTNLTLTTGNLPAISSTLTASATAFSAFTYTITATNAPTSFTASGLPSGLSANATTGVISGTPSASGAFNVALRAGNAFGTGAASTLVLTIAQAPITGGGGPTGSPPTITSHPSSQSVSVGGDATFAVFTSGGAVTYQWRKNGVAVAGATLSALTLTRVGSTDAGTYSVTVTNSFGSVESSGATLTVVTLITTAPQITTAPASQSVVVGTNVTFTVAATGGPFTYQWNKNGAPIAGATGGSLTLNNVTATAAGSYTVTVRNSIGATTSAAGVLGVTDRSITGAYFGTFGANGGTFALYIRNDRTGVFLGYARASKIALVSRDVVVDASGAFSVNVTVTVPSSATLDDRAIAAADATYTISGSIGTDGAVSGSVSGLGLTLTAPAAASGATASVAGFYQAGAAGSSATSFAIVGAAGEAFVVTQSGTTADAGKGTVSAAGAIAVTTENNATVSGSVQAATVSLTAGGVTYVGANNDARVENEKLLNLSTRSQAGTGANLLIAGFVITGTQPKPVLVRAIGPALSQFGVSGSLTAARLELYRGSTLVKTGGDWGAETNAAAIAATAARVGAFALAANSRDAAVLLTLEPGNYTAFIGGQNNATGVALAEVYDATEGAIPNAQRVVNISSRAAVGSLDSLLIGGFYVSGSVPKRVLIRGVGPGLAQFGLTGTLARTQLTLFRGGQVVKENTGWTTSADAAAIAAAAPQVGAFAFAAGSQDSAILISLEPGAYTAQVAGVGGATGLALVEIYEVP